MYLGGLFIYLFWREGSAQYILSTAEELCASAIVLIRLCLFLIRTTVPFCNLSSAILAGCIRKWLSSSIRSKKKGSEEALILNSFVKTKSGGGGGEDGDDNGRGGGGGAVPESCSFTDAMSGLEKQIQQNNKTNQNEAHHRYESSYFGINHTHTHTPGSREEATPE